MAAVVESWRNYNKVTKKGLSEAQMMAAYLGGSAFQTVIDNPVTAYRQLVQQYAKDLSGNMVDPKVASREAQAIFRSNPIAASLSGLGPRLIGVGLKRVPKFGFLLGTQYLGMGGGDVGLVAATVASIASAPFINPVRMIEKQQRAFFKQTGKQKPLMEIFREAKAKNFRPLFRGTIPLMGHSLASATTGLVGQPQLQKYVEKQLGSRTKMDRFATGLVASSIVSPIYVVMTNPLSRLEVIMQTSAINQNRIGFLAACKEMVKDSKAFGLRGMFRGQGLGIVKAIISLTMFHEGRIWCTEKFISTNKANGNVYVPPQL
jgi:hypothetical protein